MPESPKSNNAALVVIVVGVLLLLPCVAGVFFLGLFGLRAAPRVSSPPAPLVEKPPAPLEGETPTIEITEVVEPAAESKIENVRIVGEDQVLADVALDADDNLGFFWGEKGEGIGLPAPGEHEFVFQSLPEGKFSVKLGPQSVGPASWGSPSIKFRMRDEVQESQKEFSTFTATLFTFGDITKESGEQIPVGIRISPK